MAAKLAPEALSQQAEILRLPCQLSHPNGKGPGIEGQALVATACHHHQERVWPSIDALAVASEADTAFHSTADPDCT